MNNSTYIVQNGDTLYGISKQHNTSVQKIRELNNLVNDNIYPSQVLILSENGESNPSECVIYTIKKGDNLYSIARKYDTTVDAIKRYNNLTSNNLSIGQRLKIPCYIDDKQDGEMPNYTVYTVKSGDSLYSIAKKFNTTVDKIKKDNNLTSNLLNIGDTLMIEDTSGTITVDECYGEDYDVITNYIVYIVKSGDNLYSIARKYNTSVNEIKTLNNLTSNNLSIGQELKIPTSTNGSTQTTYTVQKGDNLYSIATKFNTTVNSIKQKNNLTSNNLSIGQKLII